MLQLGHSNEPQDTTLQWLGLSNLPRGLSQAMNLLRGFQSSYTVPGRPYPSMSLVLLRQGGHSEKLLGAQCPELIYTAGKQARHCHRQRESGAEPQMSQVRAPSKTPSCMLEGHLQHLEDPHYPEWESLPWVVAPPQAQKPAGGAVPIQGALGDCGMWPGRPGR